MKKIILIIFIIILSFILLFTGYFVEESVRLKHGGNPLIKLSGTCDSDKVEHMDSYTTDCHSLGFRLVRHYTLDENSTDDNRHFITIGEEFYLFNNYLIWGWIS